MGFVQRCVELQTLSDKNIGKQRSIQEMRSSNLMSYWQIKAATFHTKGEEALNQSG